MQKTTDELVNHIKKAKTIASFFEDNSAEFDSLLFVKTLKSHLETKKISKQKLVREAHLNQSYVYDILNAKKTPSRDTVVKLSFALGLTLTETTRLLKLAGYSELYPRIEREAIIIFCIENKKDICYTNDLLCNMQEKLLIESKCLGS